MNNEQYTFSDYVDAFRRRAGLFFAVLLIVFGATATYAYMLPDTYGATAEMRIDLQGPNIELLEPIMLTNYADQYVQSLEQKVMTRENLEEWLDESNAYAYRGDEVSLNQKIRQLGRDIFISMVFTSVVDERSGRDVNLITGFRTGFAGRDPEAAASIANNVSAAFLAEDKATRVASATTAANFLNQEIDEKRQEIAGIEAKIATFKENQAGKLPDLMVLNMTSLERTERELEQAQRDIRNLTQDRFFREAQLEEIRQRVGPGAGLARLEAEYLRAVSLYGPDHPDVIRIKRQVAALTSANATEYGDRPSLAQLHAELSVARERYSAEHPDVRRLERQIAEFQETGPFGGGGDSVSDPVYLQLRAQINAINTNIAGHERRAAELRANQLKLQNRIASMPQVEREYQAFQRELETANLAYESLRQRLSQAQRTESFEEGEQGARLQLIRVAEASENPTGPARLAISILGLLVATSLAGGFAIFAEMIDNTVRGSRDIRVVMNTHPIAAIPIVQNSTTRSYRRRRIFVTLISALMLGAIIFVIVGSLAA